MLDLRSQLETCLRERACFVGLGNPAQGDDGVGMRLAEAIRDARGEHAPAAGLRTTGSVVLAGTALERWAPDLARCDCDRMLLLDAVDFGGSPGSVVWLESEEIRARFPQVSTHGLSLGVWAQWLEAGGARRVALLGVQPGASRAGGGLSAPVAATVRLLARWVQESDLGVANVPGRDAPGRDASRSPFEARSNLVAGARRDGGRSGGGRFTVRS